MSERRIELPGCLNLRDVGGLRTRSSGTIRRGRLYRGGDFSGVGPEVARVLVERVGLRRSIDLRTAGEVVGRSGVSLPDPCERHHLPLFESIRPEWERPSDRSSAATARRYLEMADAGMPTLVRIIDLLGDVDTVPTVIHCAAGRDRTGIVVACLLDLLDVPDEVISADYALSAAAVDDGQPAREETIAHFLGLVRESYGSVREMLLSNGSSGAGLERLRERMRG